MKSVLSLSHSSFMFIENLHLAKGIPTEVDTETLSAVQISTLNKFIRASALASSAGLLVADEVVVEAVVEDTPVEVIEAPVVVEPEVVVEDAPIVETPVVEEPTQEEAPKPKRTTSKK